MIFIDISFFFLQAGNMHTNVKEIAAIMDRRVLLHSGATELAIGNINFR